MFLEGDLFVRSVVQCAELRSLHVVIRGAFLAALFGVRGAGFRSGVLDFGVYFTADQNCGPGEVEPEHQDDHGAEGSVGCAV